jgi:hypothetical protein
MMGNLIRDLQLQIMEFSKEILSTHKMEATDFRVIKIITTERIFKMITDHSIILGEIIHNLIFSITI